MPTTGRPLIQLLAERHAKDVFVEECSMGCQGSRRLDAWVMRKTWSPPTIIGYEIKQSRQDFLRDEKWPAYIPVCHELYWVCPPRLISVDETPAGCGLLWSAGSRLLTKKKAQRHEVDNKRLVELMSYVLMSRVQKIVANMWEANGRQTVDMWRGLLLEQSGDRIVGHACSRRLKMEVAALRKKAQECEYRARSFGHIESRMREFGLDPSAPGALNDAISALHGNGKDRELLELRRDVAHHARSLIRALGPETDDLR